MRKYTKEYLSNFLKGKNILIISCESGAAQILSSLVRNINLMDAIFVLDGPAHKIFKDKLSDIKLKNFSERLFKNADLVITGTSLVPDLERHSIKMAKDNNKYVISIVDHWVNYRERFIPIRDMEEQKNFDKFFPDEIWLTDEYAYDIALKNSFPNEMLHLIDNFYFLDLKAKLQTLKFRTSDENNLLYICEPVFEDLKLLYGNGDIHGYNEFELVKDLFDSLEKIEKYFDKLIFRLHPNEKIDKYKDLIARYAGKIQIELSSCDKKPIEVDCLNADCIVGVESMALVVGLLLNRRVFSCLPVNAKKRCSLPHKEIIHINSVTEIGNFKSNYL